MGAGNRYTLTESHGLAYQLQCGCDCFEDDIFDCDCHEHQFNHLIDTIFELPLAKKYGMTDDRQSFYYGEMYMINLNTSHHGDIVVNLSYQRGFEQEGLQEANYEKVYLKIVKHINKSLPLFQGFGYTSAHYAIGEIN
ncbi:hypothetical protein DDN60_15510 [Vibrio cholerae]|nr:hypothetical protein [Vibrio cholerae]